MRSNLILLSIVAIVAVTALIVMMVGKSSLPVEQPALIPVQQDAAGLASAPVIAPAGGSPSSDPCPKKVVAEASHTLVAAETYSVRLGVTDAAQVALDRATGAVMQKLLDASGEIDVKLLTDANLKCAAENRNPRCKPVSIPDSRIINCNPVTASLTMPDGTTKVWKARQIEAIVRGFPTSFEVDFKNCNVVAAISETSSGSFRATVKISPTFYTTPKVTCKSFPSFSINTQSPLS